MTSRATYSASSLQRAETCAPSAVIPRVRRISAKADHGSMIHEHVGLHRALFGVGPALEILPELAERYRQLMDEREVGIALARCRKFEWCPPRGSIPEVALAMFEDGHVEQVQGGRGVYDLDDGWLLPGTLDLMWSTPEPLIWDPMGVEPPRCPPGSMLMVLDLKCGKEIYVPPIETNAQVLGCTLLAARWTGAERALPMILFVRGERGIRDVPSWFLDAQGLDMIESRLRDTRARVREQARRHEAGEALSYVEGPQCEWCESAAYCPAKVSLVRSFLGGPEEIAKATTAAMLTPDKAQRLAEMQTQIDAFARMSREALKRYVEATGEAIPMSGGRAWGPHAHVETRIVPAIGMPILADEVGEESARAAVKSELSREAIKRAIKESHAERGVARQVEPATKKVMAKIAKADGLVPVSETWWSAHRTDEAEKADEGEETAA